MFAYLWFQSINHAQDPNGGTQPIVGPASNEGSTINVPYTSQQNLKAVKSNMQGVCTVPTYVGPYVCMNVYGGGRGMIMVVFPRVATKIHFVIVAKNWCKCEKYVEYSKCPLFAV